ncbi:MAG TPA: hypothetical protein VNB64_10920 [Solirubrobacteraceae bacterium]|nr:hypothetical protein [Solirubrobacteraceae bacterium]
MTAYVLAVAGAYVYVKLADGFTGIADVAVFAGVALVFAAPGVCLTHDVEPGGLRRWRRRPRPRSGPTG